MAIDPVTAKLIAKAASAVVSDEKGKKAIGGIIVGIIATALIILAIPIYILSHPLQFLGNLLGIGTPAASAVTDFKTNYDDVIPGNNDAVVKIGRFCLPLKGEVTVVQEYDGGIHDGIDLAGRENGQVIAIADGTAVAAGTVDGVNTVKIEHTDENGNVFYSVYSGLLTVFVTQGETVAAEQQIGLEGGRVESDTGSHHLHFELWNENDAPFDPYELLYAPVEGPDATESGADE